MAKPAHSRVTFAGVIGTVAAPLEQWSFNVNFPEDALGDAGSQVIDDGIAAECHNAWTFEISDHMPDDCHLTQVKVSAVGADGHVLKRPDGSYAQGIWEGDFAGQVGALPMPLQTALCVSLVTQRAGATGKGRFFLPWPGYAIEAATKRLSAANAATLAADARSFLNSLAVVMTFPPHVVSSKGYTSEVVAVKVGRAPDTMRSRREDLPEGYVSLPLA